MGMKYKILKVPKHLEEEFKRFLDLAQCNLGVADEDLTSKERAVVKFVRKYADNID
jgi:hypothetical protein